MRVLIGIQARTNSKRLDKKVYQTLWGKTILEHVWEAVNATRLQGHTVIKLVLCPQSDKDMIKFCELKGIPVEPVDGDEDDLVMRYRKAADKNRVQAIVRITADCPLLKPELVNIALNRLAHDKADYVSNTVFRSFPEGLDVQGCSMKALTWFDNYQTTQREHLFATFDENKQVRDDFVKQGYKIGHIINSNNPSFLHLSVDTKNDLDNLKNFSSKEHAWGTFQVEQITV